MQSTVSSCNAEIRCTSGNSADKKSLQSHVCSIKKFANHRQLAEESGSFGERHLPELRAVSSHLVRFRRENDVVNGHAFESASVSGDCSSITTSSSNPGKAIKCHICLKPPTTAFSQPLIRCALCRRRYHSECHGPSAPLGYNIDSRNTDWACSRCTRPSNKLPKMENSWLAPWPLSSNSSSDGRGSPIVADQRPSKRRRVQAHFPDLGNIQLTQRREKSTTLASRAKSPARGPLSKSIGFSDRKSTRVREEKVQDNGVQVVRQNVCSTLHKNDIGDSEQHKMDPDTISRLMEIADSDSRLEHLVEVLRGGKASAFEREEWNRYCTSLSSSARPLESEQVEMHTAPVIAPHRSPKVTPILSETLCSGQPSNVPSDHFSGSAGDKLSPPYSLTGHQHNSPPTQCLQEDEVVFLHERPRTPAKHAGALHDALITNSPLFVSPKKPLVMVKSCVVPVADPFAQAKRKRAQAEAELKEKQRTSENVDTEEFKVVGRPIVPTTTSSVRGGSVLLQSLPVKVQNLEGFIAGYQAELQQKNTKLQDLSAEVDRERSRLRLSLRESKQQVAGLKIELEESQRAARVAQTKYRELILKMERMPGPVRDNAPTTECTTQDVTNIELSNLRSEVSALRSLIAAKDNPYSMCDFVHRNLFLAPLVLRKTVRTVSRGRGRPPKTTSSFTDSDAETNLSEDNEEHTEEEEDINLTRNERALRAFDKAIGLPQNPIPIRVDGMLAYRDGTRDANGRLPRAKNLFKVGRNVPGELK